jgi:hypothetical protein
MGWGLGFTNIAETLLMSFEHILLIVVVLGCIIFFAKDFKVGVIMLFVASGCLFMLFYALGVNWVFALIVFFMSLIMMAFTLYAVNKQQQAGGIV